MRLFFFSNERYMIRNIIKLRSKTHSKKYFPHPTSGRILSHHRVPMHVIHIYISSFKTYTINWSERRIIKFVDSSILVRGIYNPERGSFTLPGLLFFRIIIINASRSPASWEFFLVDSSPTENDSRVKT